MRDDKDALIYLADVRIDELEAENAKLRELVLDMLRTLGPPALRVDEIECGTIYAARIHAFEGRMRELGIEVDA